MLAPRHVAAEAATVYAVHIPPELSGWTRFDWLSEEDAARAARMQSAQRRAQFAAGRWLLAHTADAVFGKSAYVVHTIEARPVLIAAAGTPAAASLSHCADLVICAVSRVTAIGVDVEAVRPRADWEGLAAWVLHPQERAQLGALDPAERWKRFYETWTLKEALAKALGIGVFGFPFRSIAVSEDGTIAHAPPEFRLDNGKWRLRRLDCGPGFAAALAWRPNTRTA